MSATTVRKTGRGGGLDLDERCGTSVRVPLCGFPDVVLHAEELSVKRHPQYQAAKSGDITSADLAEVRSSRPKSCLKMTRAFSAARGSLHPAPAQSSGCLPTLQASVGEL
jgi:hypothetical protein